MSKSSLDPTALASILIAAGVGVLLIPTGFTWLASILGLVLLILLISYDEEGYRSIPQSLAFAGVCAFCLTLASVIPYQYVYGLPTARESQLVNKWLPLTWAFITLIMTVIDRARMGARVTNAQPGAAQLGSMLTPRVQTSSTVTSAPPAHVPDEFQSAVRMEAPPPHLVRSEPLRHEPVLTAAVPAPPPPVKLTEIYVHLTGESLNLMRSVQAEALGRDYYRIVDTMPENEMWQFTPGQVVRCKKQNLSTGKAMVAMEEAPRAQ